MPNQNWLNNNNYNPYSRESFQNSYYQRPTYQKPVSRTEKYRPQAKRSFSFAWRVTLWIILTVLFEGLLIGGCLYLSINNPSWVSDYHILTIGKLGIGVIPIFIAIVEWIF